MERAVNHLQSTTSEVYGSGLLRATGLQVRNRERTGLGGLAHPLSGSANQYPAKKKYPANIYEL